MTKILSSDTPKAAITLNGIGPGFGKDSVAWSANNTIKVKRGNLSLSLAGSDKTVLPVAIGSLKQLKDVVLTADNQFSAGKSKHITLNTKFEAGPKKYQVGATWDGKIKHKQTQVKGWYTNKDKLVSGEATLTLNNWHKVNTTFNQKKLLTAKYTHTTSKHGFIVEPSYNFVKSAPAVAVTKKLGKNASTLKLAYDIKSEATSLEYNRKPFKLTVSTSVGKSLKFAKPTLAAVFENTYTF